MRLKLTVARPSNTVGGTVDVLVTVDTTVTVGDLAAAIGLRDPVAPLKVSDEGVTLAVHDGGTQRPLRHDATVADAGIRSGQTVAVVKRSSKAPMPEAGDSSALLSILEGPDAGKEFNLPAGASYVGRRKDNTVVLSDPMVSNQHARIIIGDVVEVVDLGSSNGVLVGDDLVPRAVVGSHDRVTFGDSVAQIVRRGGVAGVVAPTVEFNRAPRLDIVFAGQEFEAPEVPGAPEKARLPIATLIAPVLMAVVLVRVTGNANTLVFMALTPVMVLGSFLEQRYVSKKALQEAIEGFRNALEALDREMAHAIDDEGEGRRVEHPAVAVTLPAADQRSTLMWTRRPDRRAFLDCRLGTATLPSRNTVKLPTKGRSLPELWQELIDVQSRHQFVANVPAVVSFPEHGSLGIAGPRASVLGLARSCVSQLAVLHSPAEVVIAGAFSGANVGEWEWLKWLPHASSDHSPIGQDVIASSGGALLRLVSELEDLVERRAELSKEQPQRVPAIVLVVEDDAPIERSRLVELAEDGPAFGVHLLWLAGSVSRLPAACGVFVEADPTDPSRAMVGYTTSGFPATSLAVETVSAESAHLTARTLSPIVDAGARVDDDSDLPRAVNLLAVTGSDAAISANAVIEKWAASNSLPNRDSSVTKRRKRDNHLRSTIGVASGRNLVLDLRADGPHALVGGTTGSGKSEFLQSWVISIAAEHSPSRVTFLFVDYKGGAAFADCIALPHCVGLVTDLSPHLVQRALKSLKAELRYREHILQRKRAKDLLELERRGDPEAPPSLVIVVDEFAALINEVPEFVDGVVDVAQRGRSLGLHLVLATQNPGQSIKDNLRANTNLRVALRMADPEHSMDVIGTNQAALFDPGIPGRAVVKTGANRLTPFQTGYVGGHTSDTPPPPIITVEEWTVADRAEWEARELGAVVEDESGPNDLKRLAKSIQTAYASTFTRPGVSGQDEVYFPRRPWLDELAPVYDYARAEQSRTDSSLVFAVLDDPENQRHGWASFLPDVDGNMAIFGTGGSGKSTALRTIAVAAGLGTRGGPCHVYGIDFGTRALQMLEPLDHVGAIVNGDDDERMQRLLLMLRDTIDERASRYATVNASTIVDYRDSAKQPHEPRILVLVDALQTFRDEYDTGANMRWWDMFQNIAAEGRQVGVHVVVTVDRPGAIPSALNSMIQKRVVLRLSDENSLLALNVTPDVFAADSPPGRGVFEGRDIQVLVLGGSPNTSHQATAIDKLTTAIRGRNVAGGVAPGVGRLSDRVALNDLPSDVGGLPALGESYDTLEPIGFAIGDPLAVVGPPQSGRTTVMAGLVQAMARAGSKRFVYFGGGRSLLYSAIVWENEALDELAIADLARALSGGASAMPDAIVIEDFPSITDYDAADALDALVALCRRQGVTVLADGDTASVNQSQMYRNLFAARHGLVLQPDQYDGDNLFKTPLPPGRLPRSEFPPGRGFYIRGGKTWRVQCALPDLGADSA